MFIPKDNWYVCDRCGGYYRKSEMHKEWTGLMVCKRGCFETRHPQDFVKAVPDDMSVENARPDVDQSILTTTLSSDAAKNATTISVASISGVRQYSAIGVTLDDGTVFQTHTNLEPSGSDIYLATGLWENASSGNTVYIYAVTNDTFLTTDLTGDDY